MARVPRHLLVEEGSTNHCTWRAHNFTRVFDTDEERDKIVALLEKHKAKYGMEILSYTIMGTHPHVMCRSTLGQKEFSRFWQVVNGQYARWYNKRHDRRGQVVMERMRSPMVEDGHHQLAVMRYTDLNPVHAGLVKSAAHWKWSSHRHYAYGEPNNLITDAPEYLALGQTGPERRRAYLHLFAQPLPEVPVAQPELVNGPFIGSPEWAAPRYRACGLSPPEAPG